MPASDATLLDVLIDGFEKNETLGGFHWRDLPCLTEADARDRFGAFVEEATRWKGVPTEAIDSGRCQKAVWPDLRIRQAGRGVRIEIRAPRFDRWWHDGATWAGEPMSAIWAWHEEEARARKG
jgi:hypothetical protein